MISNKYGHKSTNILSARKLKDLIVKHAPDDVNQITERYKIIIFPFK